MLAKKVLLAIEKEPAFIKTIKLDVLKKTILKADEKYYNDEEPLMSDNVYDHIRNYIVEQDPNFQNKQHADVKVKDANKVKLPVWMGSMTKKKELKGSIYNVIVSDKLDGVSCLVDKRSGKEVKLYTRGNGKFGRDISYLLQYINGIDTNLKNRDMVRGELIMKVSTFAQLKESESNPRNTVAGFVNSKTPNEKYKNKVDFIAYEVLSVSNETKIMKPSEQMVYLGKTSFLVVPNESITKVDKPFLSNLLKTHKQASLYEIDGIIVSKDETYILNDGGNPTHAFAYKENSVVNHVKTIVQKVEWNISKDKLLKPIVHIEPVLINNVCIKKTTGYNAKYINDNKIGKGTQLTIERSGDVIPKIVSIDKATQADMPTSIKYEWSKSGVDIFVSDDETSQTDAINLKVFQNMLKKLDFKNMGEGTVKKLFASNVRTIRDVYDMTLVNIKDLDGFHDKSANNLFDSIQSRKKTLTCLNFMAASNSFGSGFGEKVLSSIVSKYDPMNTNITPTIDNLKAIDGIGGVTAKNYLEGLKQFNQFIKSNKLDSVCVVQTKTQNENKPIEKVGDMFKGKIVLFTGFRDTDLEEHIIKNGGVVKATMSKQVNLIIYKTINKKVETAMEKNIDTLTLDDFKKSFV
jgi:DNA ligase (NAD+)